MRYIFLNQKIKVLLDVLNFGLYFFLSTKSCFLTMMRVPVDHAGHKSIVCPFSYLVMSLETTPVVIGVEGPSSTVGGLQARILASFLINIVSVANWLPIVPVENGTGQSATPLASMRPVLGASRGVSLRVPSLADQPAQGRTRLCFEGSREVGPEGGLRRAAV